MTLWTTAGIPALIALGRVGTGWWMWATGKDSEDGFKISSFEWKKLVRTLVLIGSATTLGVIVGFEAGQVAGVTALIDMTLSELKKHAKDVVF